MREFQCLDDYILKCYKCNRYGHLKHECKQDSAHCGRCNKPGCNYACDKKEANCVNCNGNHSSNYKGCSKYKEQTKKAQESIKKKEDNRNLQKMQHIVKEINTNELKKSYAETIKNKTALDETHKQLEEIEKRINETEKNIDLLKNDISKYVTFEELYEIIYECLWLQSYNGYDSSVQLKQGISTTIRGKSNQEKEDILMRMDEVEKLSSIFETSFNDNNDDDS